MISAINSDEMSPLQLAISCDRFHTVKFLLSLDFEGQQSSILNATQVSQEVSDLHSLCSEAIGGLENDSDFDYQHFLDRGVPPELTYREALRSDNMAIAIILNSSIPDWLRQRFCSEIDDGDRLYQNFLQERTDTVARRTVDFSKDSLSLPQIQFKRRIDAGRFGTVFRGEFKPSEDNMHDVAIKVPAKAEFELEIPREYNCLKHLCESKSEFRNLIVFPYGLVLVPDITGRNQMSLVMELCQQSLYKHLCSHICESLQLLTFCLQATQAVRLAHQEGIYHADLSLRNFMIAMDGTLKLGDFGASRTGYTREILPEKRVGTELYTAPELHNFELNPTIFADIYSLGVCFVAIFNRGETPSDVKITDILKGGCVPCDSIPFLELRSITEQMVHHDPDARPSLHMVIQIIQSEMQ